MLTITMHWWYLPLGLFIAPFLFVVSPLLPEDKGGYSPGLWSGLIALFVFAACWLAALGICIGHWMAS